MTFHRTKLLIIGSGPAGYTAAIYAGRAALDPVVLQGPQPGGQLTITSDVENWPGEPSILGPELMERMQAQAEGAGATLVYDLATEVDFSRRPFVCKTDSGDVYAADAVVVATGAQAKWLGLDSEKRHQGRGVSGCATCDAPLFRNKKVAVVGGGNAAVEEALYLSKHASEVTVIHRRDAFRAEKILQERLFQNAKINVVWDSVVEEILGTTRNGEPGEVVGARLKNLRTGRVSDLPCQGVFIAIGHAPATELFRGHLPMDAEGYIRTEPGSPRTAVPGVWAVGDVADRVYRQAVVAAGTGCMAALEAEKFLAAEDHAQLKAAS